MRMQLMRLQDNLTISIIRGLFAFIVGYLPIFCFFCLYCGLLACTVGFLPLLWASCLYCGLFAFTVGFLPLLWAYCLLIFNFRCTWASCLLVRVFSLLICVFFLPLLWASCPLKIPKRSFARMYEDWLIFCSKFHRIISLIPNR